MARTFVYRQGRGVIPIEEAEPLPSWEPNKGVICDTLMTPLEHPANGLMYDSKSAFRSATKANGCIEVGNDLVGKPKRHGDKSKDVVPEKFYKTLHDKIYGY